MGKPKATFAQLKERGGYNTDYDTFFWSASLAQIFTYFLLLAYLATKRPVVHHRTSFTDHRPFLAIASATSSAADPCTFTVTNRPSAFSNFLLVNLKFE